MNKKAVDFTQITVFDICEIDDIDFLLKLRDKLMSCSLALTPTAFTLNGFKSRVDYIECRLKYLHICE